MRAVNEDEDFELDLEDGGFQDSDSFDDDDDDAFDDEEDDDSGLEDEEDEEDDDDELEGFSAAQKAKIQKRIAKVQQERDEALGFAAKANNAAKAYQARLTATEKVAVGEIKQSADTALAVLKAQLKEAIEEGDADKQVELNSEISEALLRKRSAEAAEQKIKEAPEYGDASPEPMPGDVERHKAWISKNSASGGGWFDPSGDAGDPEMTAVALATHAKLIRSGVRINSPEYYAGINKRMSALYPDKFRGSKAVERQKPRGNAAAPMSRKPGAASGGKIVMKITPSQRAIAKRLGLSSEQYLKAKAQYDRENG